eukprot:5678564-Prymnesium_polylepis.1
MATPRTPTAAPPLTPLPLRLPRCQGTSCCDWLLSRTAAVPGAARRRPAESAASNPRDQRGRTVAQRCQSA